MSSLLVFSPIQITLTYIIQVLGVLVVAQCHDKDDLRNVEVGFKESCAQFQRTLCDSRCVIYGPKKALEGKVDSHKGYCVIDCNVDMESFTKDDVNAGRSLQGCYGLFTHDLHHPQVPYCIPASFGEPQGVEVAVRGRIAGTISGFKVL